MTKRNFIILVIIILVIGGAVYGLSRVKKEKIPSKVFPEEPEEIIVELDEETVNYISTNIDSLSPEEPVLGGSWYILRFSLIDENHLYVTCEDGHIRRRLLLEKKEEKWQLKAYFKPGKDMWNLVSGEDNYLGAPLTIYEKNEETGKWELIH